MNLFQTIHISSVANGIMRPLKSGARPHQKSLNLHYNISERREETL